ncbi:hypothetical protein SAMN05446635_6037 [Burkholderia sp. OK233]|nr:hypothetical protein SAMN05446635_6037 [Burkholderia sp. OK233]
MATILEPVKRASLARNRRAAAMARLRVALSIHTVDTRQLPGVAILAAQAQRYRPHVVEVTQDSSLLQAHSSNYSM